MVFTWPLLSRTLAHYKDVSCENRCGPHPEQATWYLIFRRWIFPMGGRSHDVQCLIDVIRYTIYENSTLLLSCPLTSAPLSFWPFGLLAGGFSHLLLSGSSSARPTHQLVRVRFHLFMLADPHCPDSGVGLHSAFNCPVFTSIFLTPELGNDKHVDHYI